MVATNQVPMSSPARRRKAPAKPPAYIVWEAYAKLTQEGTGFVVTQAACHDLPIAWVAYSADGVKRDCALEVAGWIAANPDLIADYEDAVDLRPYCATNSVDPMPEHLLDLRLGVPGKGAFSTISFVPFCAHRLRRYVAAAATIRFGDDCKEWMQLYIATESITERTSESDGDNLFYVDWPPARDRL